MPNDTHHGLLSIFNQFCFILFMREPVSQRWKVCWAENKNQTAHIKYRWSKTNVMRVNVVFSVNNTQFHCIYLLITVDIVVIVLLLSSSLRMAQPCQWFFRLRFPDWYKVLINMTCSTDRLYILRNYSICHKDIGFDQVLCQEKRKNTEETTRRHSKVIWS